MSVDYLQSNFEISKSDIPIKEKPKIKLDTDYEKLVKNEIAKENNSEEEIERRKLF